MGGPTARPRRDSGSGSATVRPQARSTEEESDERQTADPVVESLRQLDGELLHGGGVALFHAGDGLLEGGDVRLELFKIHEGLLLRGLNGR